MFHVLKSGKRVLRQSRVLGEGSLLAAVLYVFVGGLAATVNVRPPDVSAPLVVQVIEVVAFVTLSIGPSAYWVFRRALRDGTRQDAARAARTFAVVAPVGMCIGSPLAWGAGAAIDAVLMARSSWGASGRSGDWDCRDDFGGSGRYDDRRNSGRDAHRSSGP
jgi:hypothetical protein